MRVATWNVNGLRACGRKGFADWLQSERPDILGLQEVRALPEDLDVTALFAGIDRRVNTPTFRGGRIQAIFGGGEVDPGSGQFTFGLREAYLIENGQVTAPIKDVNIIGNGPESLKRITMVANDARLDTGGWTCGKNGQSVPVSQGIPTVLVSNMTVGGENAS